jgi:hypothetical protein
LIELHRQRRPDDVMLHFFTGQAEMLDDEYDRAEEAFAAGMARRPDEPVLELFRGWRVYARFQAGKGLSAYGEIGPARATFNQLAQLFLEDDDVEQLDVLLAAHRQADPDDGNLFRWEAQGWWHVGDYETALQVLTEHRRDILTNEANRDPFYHLLVRSLIRAKRFEVAIQEAEAVWGKGTGSLDVAAAHAAAGNVTKTAQALERCEKEGYEAADFHNDPDLGPALRSDRFRELRQKYPEPKPPAERL